MAAIADYDTFKTKIERAMPWPFYKGGGGIATALLNSSWGNAMFTGATPSTAGAPTDTAEGAFLGSQTGAYTNDRYIGQIQTNAIITGTNANACVIADRLSHQGGLSGIVTTAQTTNLPTAALTRYTSGEGVMIALEIYTQIGTTATTVTASYTNTTPTSGRTTKPVAFGGSLNREARRVFVLPLQDGDTGVTSVESVTVLATTGTAGNFGVTLFKPLLPIFQGMSNQHQYAPSIQNQLLGGLGIFPVISDNACLWLLNGPGSASTTITGTVQFIEG